jgi:lambda family phage tail tape measure protein
MAQAAILKAKNDEMTAVELRAFVEDKLAKAEQANFEASDQRFRFTQDNLRVADQLATTAEDHRRIQLQILDSEMAQRRYELEHEKQLAVRNGSTAEQIKVIQDQIDNLSQERANGAAAINRNTQNPLEAWAQTVPKTAAEINEALQSIEVKGIDGLSDALTDVITGTTSLKEAFHQLAASVLRDLIAMTIKMLIFKAIQAAMGGGFGGGDLGASNASLDSMGAPGFAMGGSFTIRGRSGTDKNLLALNGLPLARVGNMERINISNDNGGAFPPATVVYQTFDLHGAVVTSDLLRQMDEKSQRAAQEGAKLGVKSMMDLNSRTYGKALGG